MDPSVQPQQRRLPSEPITKIEEEDEDVADFYQYVPRRRGDFPPVGYLPPNEPPSVKQYDILDRIFEDDLPIYVLRPQSHTYEQEVLWQRFSESPRASLEPRRDDSKRLGALDVAPGLRTSSARQPPASVRSKPSYSLAYDPDDPTIILVELGDVLSYVTQRALERYETYRFENPQPEDFPIIVQRPRESSEDRNVERDHEAQEREGIKVAKPRGRPPKKKSKLGPAVIVERPDDEFSTTRSLPLRGLRNESDVSSPQSPIDAEMYDADIVPSIEKTASDLNMLNVADTLRKKAGPSSTKPKKRMLAVSQTSEPVAFSSKLAAPGHSDQHLSRDVSESHAVPKRRGRPPKSLAKQLHLSSLRPSPSLSGRRSTQPSEANGNHNTSVTSSRNSPKPTSQSTIQTYLSAMSKAKEATRPPSFPAQRQTSRKQTPVPALKAGRKKRPPRTDPVNQFEEPVIKVNSEPIDDSDEGNYEISHIIGHDDSQGERFYLVAWKGFDASQATYLTKAEMRNAKGLLKKYLSSLMEVEAV